MDVEWDEAKNARSIALRGLSFDLVQGLAWDAAFIVRDNRKDYGEPRWRAVAKGQDGRFYHVAFTFCDEVLRVISFRRANKREEKSYETQT